MPKPQLSIPMNEEAATKWQARIEAAHKFVERRAEDWKRQNSSYTGDVLDDVPSDDVVLVNKDMPRVKQKVSQLFFQVPEVQLKAKRPEYIGAVQTFQAVVNHKLTHDVKAVRTIDEVLTDVIAVSGIGVSKVGIDITTVDVDMPMVDEQTAAVLRQQGLEVPTEKAPVPIHREYFWKRISPAKLLLPPEFTGTDFDEAPFIGFKYRIPINQAKSMYGIGEDKASSEDKNVVTESRVTEDKRTQKEVECCEIWYKAHLYDTSVKNPVRQRRLVFVDGEEKPVVHEDSPYQRFDEYGRLTVGMKRYPIRVLTLTTVPDEAIPPSDTKISRPLVAELQQSRTQMVRQRKRSIPLRWFNTTLMDPATAEKIEAGEMQDMIPLNAPGDSAVGEVARANYPRESFEFQRVIENDLSESWSLGSNQLSGSPSGEQSATEANLMQTNANVRLDYERNKVLRWFLDAAEQVGDLVQLFADDAEYIEVVGEDRTKTLQQWDKQTVAGEFIYSARTNSQLRLDIGAERQDARNAYQLLVNDPYINRQTLVEWIGESHGIPMDRIMVQPEPPKPPAPNISFRFNGEELNPVSPSFPIVMEVLRLGGFQIDPALIENAKMIAQANLIQPGLALAATGQSPEPAPGDTEHGGPAEQAESLSKSQETDGDYR